jgi:curved DNA-binding protein CbpA
MDPYRTLGLEPGASGAEVKRAYRRLAKAFHPDSAGAAALPRFLAIQEAYELLVAGGRIGRRGAGGAAASGPAAAGAEPWRADPVRARAARERARTRRAGPAPAGGAGSRSASGPSAAGSSSGPATGPSAAGASSGRSGPSSRPGGGARPAGRRRATRKATLGSTSYDEARDANDPTWAGAAWYGPTSGEYWTVNPREYADPRKHGPEYQSRARRGSTTGADWDPEWAGESPAADAAADAGLGEAPGASRRSASGHPAWTPPPRPSQAFETAAPSRVAPSPVRSILGADLSDPVRRLGFALLAWAPLGVASAAAIGQATGCATYSASCGPTAPLLPWLAQAVILGLLLLVPAVSRILAVGTVVLLASLLPIGGFFITFGGAGRTEAAVPLTVLLTLAWAAGVAAAVMAGRRVRAPAGRS